MNGGFSPAWMLERFRQLAAVMGIALVALLLVGPGASTAAAKKRKSPLPSELLGFTPNTAVTHQDLRRMDRIGASTIRYNLAWSVLQRRRHNPIDWDKPDRFIKRASRAGAGPRPPPRHDARLGPLLARYRPMDAATLEQFREGEMEGVRGRRGAAVRAWRLLLGGASGPEPPSGRVDDLERAEPPAVLGRATHARRLRESRRVDGRRAAEGGSEGDDRGRRHLLPGALEELPVALLQRRRPVEFRRPRLSPVPRAPLRGQPHHARGPQDHGQGG